MDFQRTERQNDLYLKYNVCVRFIYIMFYLTATENMVLLSNVDFIQFEYFFYINAWMEEWNTLDNELNVCKVFLN